MARYNDPKSGKTVEAPNSKEAAKIFSKKPVLKKVATEYKSPKKSEDDSK